MYEDFFRLTHDPFRLTPDPSFCFGHRHYAKARVYIDYALHRGEGFVMVTGRPGTGKTTLAMDLIDKTVGTNVKVVLVVSTQLDADDLLRMTAFMSDLDAQAPRKGDILQRLIEFFVQQREQGRRVLLVIDEAQDLSFAALEELRLLTNLQHRGEPLVPILLLGQESFRDLVQRPGMEQVHQRIVAAWHLAPLDPSETVEYVRFRLERAGWQGEPSFDPGVLRSVYGFSQGVPRRINLVCGRLLLRAFGEERRVVTVADAEAVLAELAREGLEPMPVTASDRPPELASGAAESEVDWAQVDRGLSWAGPVVSDSRAGVPESVVRSERADTAMFEQVEDSEGSRVAVPRDEAALAGPRTVEVPARSGATAPTGTAVRSSGVGAGDQGTSVGGATAPARRSRSRWVWATTLGLLVLAGLGALLEPAVWVGVRDRIETGWQDLAGEGAERTAPGVAQAGSEPGPPVAERSSREPLVSPPVAERSSAESVSPPPVADRRTADPVASPPVSMETEIRTADPATAGDSGPVVAALSLVEVPLPASGGEDEPLISALDVASDGGLVLASDPNGSVDDLAAILDEDVEAIGGRPETSGFAAEDQAPEAPEEIVESPARLELDLADRTVERLLVVGPVVEEATPVAEPEEDAPVLPLTQEAVAEPDRVADVTADFLADDETAAMRAEGLTVRVLFGWDSTRIEPRFEPDLAAVVDAMTHSAASVVEVVGYTDRRGDPRYNQYLSQQRAQAVSDYLAEQGIARDRHRVEGRGPREPDGGAGIPGSEVEPEDRMVKLSVILAPGT